METALSAETFRFRTCLLFFLKYSLGFLLIMSISCCSVLKKMTVYESGNPDDGEIALRISDESNASDEDDESDLTGDEAEEPAMSEIVLPENEDELSAEQKELLTECQEEISHDETEKQGMSADDAAFYAEYSEKLGIRLDGTENKRLIKAAARWMGAPYKWGGCLKSGVDCSCLVKLIYKEVYGIRLNRTSVNIVNKDISPVTKAGLKEGDIVSFKRSNDSRISHIGIYLKNNKFLHVSRKKGVMISDLGKRYYRTWFFSAGRSLEKTDKKPYMASSSALKGRIKLGELAVLDSVSPRAGQTGPGTRLLAKASELSAKVSGMP